MKSLQNMGSMLRLLRMSKMKEGNLSTKTTILTSLVSCEVLGLTTPFVGACWGHAMFKCCQYATNDSKICVGITSISIKEA
jgi:hypothetical protein